DKENHLLRATIQKGNSVTIESYTYDYAGNRTSKTINETDTTYYVNDTSSSLTMVVAETNKDGKEVASYTRGDELLSVERDGEVWYYLYDGHGSVRTLTNEAGRVTDRYSYDAYGNLLEKEGDTKNEFLYTGEQYNANTGLYYLRARYMNPSTGTFISMDSYQGSIYDPVTLHKYLYANANPVMYTDPSGYTSVAEAGTYMSCTTSLSVAQAYYDAMVFAIGMNIIAQLRAIAAVETVARISSETMLAIGLEGALSGSSNTTAISNELLLKVVHTVTLAYMISGDCIALDVVASSVEETKVWIETSAIELRKENKKQYKGHSVYVLRDSKNRNKVSYVGRSKNPWKRHLQHRKDLSKQTDGKPWDMYIVKSGLTKKEAAALENALICIYTIDALANARHEIAVKNFDGFEKEFGRAASICRIPLTQLKDVMKGDYK
ncbi:MAG: GIY-YIG nuclease family protein, partial [Lachnospiraceae bacterium]|nr:GIY-YIG nuclease family protein [Lachnospiraceae bacterium]